jgi:hypothetical protein
LYAQIQETAITDDAAVRKLTCIPPTPTNPKMMHYFGSETYRNKTADEKLDDLWGQCNEDMETEPVSPSYELLKHFTRNHTVAFTDTSDEISSGAYGGVCPPFSKIFH